MDTHHEDHRPSSHSEPGSSATRVSFFSRLRGGTLVGLALLIVSLLVGVGITTAENTRSKAQTEAPLEAPTTNPQERPSLLGAYLETRDGAELFERAPEADQEWFFEQLVSFYEARDFDPVWIDGGQIAFARDLLRELEAADEHGLDPDEYGMDELRTLIDELASDRYRMPGELFELEVATTASALLYLEHLLAGRVHPDETEAEWNFEPAHANVSAALAHALRAPTLWDGLEALEPSHSDYDGLQRMLKVYLAKAADGEWATVPDGESLALGDTDEPARLRALADRLAAEGDLSSARHRLVLEQADQATADGAPMEYGVELEEALRSFQERHGLAVDGKLGPNTLAALNVSLEHRVKKIAANLDRWRWLDRRLPPDRIMVNIASYTLAGYRDGREELAMDVVVGKPTWKTPVFHDEMTYLEINPYWNVPASIAAAEILPAVRRDPSYLQRQNMEVLRGWNGNDPSADVSNIDWSSVGPRDVRFRQRPGPRNSLGRIKFMFPNEHNVYLHDTPSQSGFAKDERALSHGCVRVADPEALADFVLQDHPSWTGDDVRDAIATRRMQRVSLETPLPVYILYWTAFPGDDGRPNFRDDVYGYDDSLIEELEVDDLIEEAAARHRRAAPASASLTPETVTSAL